MSSIDASFPLPSQSPSSYEFPTIAHNGPQHSNNCPQLSPHTLLVLDLSIPDAKVFIPWQLTLPQA